jgi:hypothetical protein
MTQDSETTATPKRLRRQRSTLGGFSLKLDAPERKGYTRRFVNGDPLRIARMKELGYDFVTEEAGAGNVRTDSQGTRISRFAGKQENGEPYQTYLMETPTKEFEFGLADKEEARKPFEDAIRRSADTTGQVENAYQPGVSTIKHSG